MDKEIIQKYRSIFKLFWNGEGLPENDKKRRIL